MTSIRETVARAMMADTDDAPLSQWDKANSVTKEIYRGNAFIAINTFLEAAAEQGWRMRPDQATEEMRHAAFIAMDNAACRGDPKARAFDCLIGYRAMLACPSAKFELDK